MKVNITAKSTEDHHIHIANSSSSQWISQYKILGVAFIGILEQNRKGNFISRKLIHPYLIWKNKLITNLIGPKYTVYKRKNNKCPEVEY